MGNCWNLPRPCRPLGARGPPRARRPLSKCSPSCRMRCSRMGQGEPGAWVRRERGHAGCTRCRSLLGISVSGRRVSGPMSNAPSLEPSPRPRPVHSPGGQRGRPSAGVLLASASLSPCPQRAHVWARSPAPGPRPSQRWPSRPRTQAPCLVSVVTVRARCSASEVWGADRAPPAPVRPPGAVLRGWRCPGSGVGSSASWLRGLGQPLVFLGCLWVGGVDFPAPGASP